MPWEYALGYSSTMDTPKIGIVVGLSEGPGRDAVLALPCFGGDTCWEAIPIVAAAEAESVLREGRAQAVVADLSFDGGELVDRLALWPTTLLLITKPSDPPIRIAAAVSDESSIFLEMDRDSRWLELLPLSLRKVLSTRESIARQNAALRLTESQYARLLAAVPDIVYMLDEKGRFIYLNEAIRGLGWEPSALIGRHFSALIHPEDVKDVSLDSVLEHYKGKVTGPAGAPKLFDERRCFARMTKGLALRLRMGGGGDKYATARVDAYGEINSVGYDLPRGEEAKHGTVGIIHDVTERLAYERELEFEVSARETLLKEIHHRVKNNLQVVSSILSLQENAIDDEASRTVFRECQTQVQSMAMVHEALYRGSSMERVEMRPYLLGLADYLAGIYDAEGRGVAVVVEEGNCSLALDAALSLALIANELISNCYKHAFPGDRRGALRIAIGEKDGETRFMVKDDGIGFSLPPVAADGGRKSLGTELVDALCLQLKGRIERSNDGGAKVVLVFHSI